MDSQLAKMTQSETTELQDSFMALAQHVAASPKPSDEDRQTKKAKVKHQAVEGQEGQTKLIQLMASMIIRLDHDAQLLRKQDSYVFFLQMESEGIVHELLKQGKMWHHKIQNPTTMDTETQKPLRVVLIQKLVSALHHRLDQLSRCTTEDPFY